MQGSMEDPIAPMGLSYTEALMDQGPLDYFEWCTAFLQHHPPQHSNHYGLLQLPSVVPQSMSYYQPQYSCGNSFLFNVPSDFKPHMQLPSSMQMPSPHLLVVRDTNNDNAVVPKAEVPSPTLISYSPNTHLSHSGSLSPVPSSPPSASSSPLPPHITAIPPAAQHRTTTIPEFIHSPLGLDNLHISSDTLIWHLQEPLHRNYYHTIQFRVPSAAYATSPNGVGSNYEGYRIYVHPQLGYSGNAKRFKQAPEAGEKAFILEGMVLDHHFQPIQQCAACLEYFENKSYFVANPHCKGRILLVKNNQVTRIKQGVFSLNMKPMCCSRHHQSPFYFYFILRDTLNSRVVMTSLFMCHVKQWKKTSSSNPSKRRKMSPSSPNSDASLSS